MNSLRAESFDSNEVLENWWADANRSSSVEHSSFIFFFFCLIETLHFMIQFSDMQRFPRGRRFLSI